MVFTTNTPLAMSRTPSPYDVAPLDAAQLSVAVLLASTGPGLLVDPGLRLVGVGGTVTVDGVWKYSSVAKLEHPALLQAWTFHSYCLFAVSVSLADGPLTVVFTTNTPLATSRTANW